MDLDLVFDAIRGPEGSQVELDLARRDREGGVTSSHVSLTRRRVGAKPMA